MQRIINGVAQQVLGTCRCPQCTPRNIGNAVKSYHSSYAPRRILTGSTIFASAGFALASSMELGMKQQRRDQWNNALADVSEKVAAKTLQNDTWQKRIGVDDATIAEHLRRDEEYGYLFGDDEPDCSTAQESQAATEQQEQPHDEELPFHVRRAFYPWSRPAYAYTASTDDFTELSESHDDTEADVDGHRHQQVTASTNEPGASNFVPFVKEHDYQEPEESQEELELSVLHEDFTPPGESPANHMYIDRDQKRAAAIRERYGPEITGDGPLDYYQQLNGQSAAGADKTGPEFEELISANCAMANILARSDHTYNPSLIRVVSVNRPIPHYVVAELQAGLPDLSASPSILSQSSFQEEWPANTGSPLIYDRLPKRSIYRAFDGPEDIRQTQFATKKKERIKLCMHKLECTLLEYLRSAAYIVDDSAYTPRVTDVLGIATRVVIQRELSYLERDIQRLYQADGELQDYYNRQAMLPLSQYDRSNDMFRPLKLHTQLRQAFEECRPDKESRIRVLCKVFEALTDCKTIPELHTLDILVAGFSDCGFPMLASFASLSLRRAKLAPNESTLAVVLSHHARYNQSWAFETWVRIMLGHHGGLELFPVTEVLDIPQLAQLRPNDHDSTIIAYKPYPNPKILTAMINGTLKLYGLEEALDRAKRWGEHGWGLCIESLTSLIKAAVKTGDTDTAMQMWQLADDLQQQSAEANRPEAIPEELLSTMLQVLEADGTQEEINYVLGRGQEAKRQLAAREDQQTRFLHASQRLRESDLINRSAMNNTFSQLARQSDRHNHSDSIAHDMTSDAFGRLEQVSQQQRPVPLTTTADWGEDHGDSWQMDDPQDEVDWKKQRHEPTQDTGFAYRPSEIEDHWQGEAQVAAQY